jgi:imidazolonepropionase-like amidohydrolase
MTARLLTARRSWFSVAARRATLSGAVAFGACMFLSVGSPASSQNPPPRVIVLKNVTVIDGTGAPPSSGMDVILEGDRISTIAVAGTRQPPSNADVQDLSGRVLIPGLIDAHIHLLPRFLISRETAYGELQRMLYGGVVAAREMVGDTRLTAEAARTIIAGDAVGPEIYWAALMAGPRYIANNPRIGQGALGFRPGEVPWAQGITAETDLRLAVARAAGTLATGIKLYTQLDAELIRRITEEAHRQGLKVWGHATVFPTRPLDVVSAGVDVVSHACDVAWQSAALDPSPGRFQVRNNRPSFDPSLVDAQSAEMTALFKEMVRRGTMFEPTLYSASRPDNDIFACTGELAASLTRAAHRAGVTLVAGTDHFVSDDDLYPSLHEEIRRLVDMGGLTPLEAITAATRHGARALGLEATHGTIEAGKVSNLVVLEADPSRDIKALRAILMVIKRGRMYPRANFKPIGKALGPERGVRFN